MKKWLSSLMALLCISSATLAYALPIDFSPAPAANPSGYISPTEYQDDSLHVWLETVQQDSSNYHVAHITISDPSQLRTALAGEPGSKTCASVQQIAQGSNAVVAINGDYYAYRGKGYIVRQRQVLRKSGQTELDMLLIDSAGDFHPIRKVTTDKVKEALKSCEVINCFVFGPVLVMDGQVQTVYNSYGFAPQDRSPRTAIGQIGPLEYVMVVVDGRQNDSRGVTHKQLAAFMGQLGCQTAFNLDGGGSSALVFGGEVYNSLSDETARAVSDIVYVGTAIE